MPKLYRGIAVSANNLGPVVDSIQLNGLQPVEERCWRNDMPDPAVVRQKQEDFLKAPARIRDAILSLPSAPLVYACGDKFGACYYALRHNHSAEHKASLLVEFEAPVERLCVDGKDFLYTVFQLWDRSGVARRNEVRQLLAQVFGEAVLPYFDRAAQFKETMGRTGLCDLACHDLSVISTHLSNETLIKGRYGTEFCSSFQLQLPVPASAIREITTDPVMPESSRSCISIHEILQ